MVYKLYLNKALLKKTSIPKTFAIDTMAIPFHICGNLRKVNPTATQLGSGEARFETYKAVLLIGGRSHFLKLAWAVPSNFPGHLTPMFGARHVFKLQQLLLR